jgi:branched-chain amino acid transport system ATP-binding protein
MRTMGDPATGESAALLKIVDVSLSFGGLRALSSVSIDVREGSITGLIGPNGAGKTSLLNCINGVLIPQSGQIIYNGKNIVGVKTHRLARMGIARTFQGVEILSGESVIDNVLLGRESLMGSGLVSCAFRLPRSRREEAQQRDQAEQVLESFDLHTLRDRRVGDLPYGLQKLVSIARAVAMDPSLLLLDEPTSGMSALEKSEIADVLTRLSATRGLTEVIIEHDVRLIRELCDDVYVLNFGQVIAEGPPEVALNDALVIEAYLGKGVETAA